MMHRSIRKHDSDAIQAGRDGCRKRGGFAQIEQNDWGRATFQEVALARAHYAVFFSYCGVTHHQRERLAVSSFAFS